MNRSDAMLRPCSFESCMCRSRHRRHGITFHEFPESEEIRTKWVAVVRVDRHEPRWTPTPLSRVCSLHFSRSQFLSRKVLHGRAVPTAKYEPPKFMRAYRRPAEISTPNEDINLADDIPTENFPTSEEMALAAANVAAANAKEREPDVEMEAKDENNSKSGEGQVEAEQKQEASIEVEKKAESSVDTDEAEKKSKDAELTDTGKTEAKNQADNENMPDIITEVTLADTGKSNAAAELKMPEEQLAIMFDTAKNNDDKAEVETIIIRDDEPEAENKREPEEGLNKDDGQLATETKPDAAKPTSAQDN